MRSRQPAEPAGDWLARILADLPADDTIKDGEVDQLAFAVNGPLGDEQRHIEEDWGAFVDFWRLVSERLPSHPRARAAYADTLLLTGDVEGARREMLAAFREDPLLIYRMSGEYRDVMEQAGGRDWATYRALAVRAAALDGPDTHREYIAEELKSLMNDVRDDPALRALVLEVLGPLA